LFAFNLFCTLFILFLICFCFFVHWRSDLVVVFCTCLLARWRCDIVVVFSLLLLLPLNCLARSRPSFSETTVVLLHPLFRQSPSTAVAMSITAFLVPIDVSVHQ